MAVEWYYADAHNQQQGPVAAAALAGYYRDGVVNAGTLVWREGLAGWVPLRDVAAQLGLIVINAPTAPAAPAGAPGARLVKPAGSSSSAAIIVIVLLIGAVAVLGILAAIALPAYQDYTLRAKVTQGVIQAAMLKVAVAEYKLANDKCPRNGDEGFGSAESYATQFVSAINIGPLKNGGDCGIQITFSGTKSSSIDGKKITLALDKEDNWHPTSDVPAKYLPMSLRNDMR